MAPCEQAGSLLCVLEDLEFEEDPDPPVQGCQGPVNFDLEENDTASEAPVQSPQRADQLCSLQDEVTPKNDEEERVYAMVW